MNFTKLITAIKAVSKPSTGKSSTRDDDEEDDKKKKSTRKKYRSC